jgi:type 1 glutamine amidotransferase
MYRTLLLTGEHNHDWERTAPYYKLLLEQSGKFNVDLAKYPSDVLQDGQEIGKYDLFVLDYNGKPWGEAAEHNFAAAVNKGKGVVIIHGSNNSFAGWTEYERMMGIAWRDNISGHGAFHEFKVHITDRSHPITRHIDDFLTTDELYHRLVPMHDTPFTVLATAYSDKNQGGTGNHEPMMLVTQYGEGRVFHLALGHVWPDDPRGLLAVKGDGFRTSLLRGCEWAAGGEPE